ncbi:MAG TPA: phosphoribosylformylglycinamidine cyclo-ligase [Alphaproteobacteria bacterium]|nr:phosphoribosylformylglycinamidine cyclo-ligase [Alphaproteobacteria bacterium]HIN92964.1 phosphoribosylformylglycinamidine cyclo-ligase [Alphaproteobacteria bacterium]
MSDSPGHKYTYSDAGVDIEAGQSFIDLIKPLAKTTATPGGNADLGGFGALFDIRAAGFEDPVLVATTDGVGTKLLLANAVGSHKTVGIDLVAMCVNDLVVQGAKPLFFLDYLATGQLDVKSASQVVEGITIGCHQAGCALIGGETAEMPGLYAPGHYDLAGFSVGAAERSRLLTGNDICAGDQILGLASSGIHANGFSLVRKLIAEHTTDLEGKSPFDPAQSLADSLLTPTRIYVSSILSVLYQPESKIKGLAHITGGGIYENIPRILPPGVGANLDASCWPLPRVFRWLRQLGNIDCDEMARTFNCGIGMAVVVSVDKVGHVKKALSDDGEIVHHIGEITPRDPNDEIVVVDNLEPAWK